MRRDARISPLCPFPRRRGKVRIRVMGTRGVTFPPSRRGKVRMGVFRGVLDTQRVILRSAVPAARRENPAANDCLCLHRDSFVASRLRMTCGWRLQITHSRERGNPPTPHHPHQGEGWGVGGRHLRPLLPPISARTPTNLAKKGRIPAWAGRGKFYSSYPVPDLPLSTGEDGRKRGDGV